MLYGVPDCNLQLPLSELYLRYKVPREDLIVFSLGCLLMPTEEGENLGGQLTFSFC